jgi:fructose-1-phosphate kinase PfkB-like protein
LAREVIALARKRGIAVVVDPKGTDYSKYRGATVVKPNVVEVERVLKHEIGDAAALDYVGLGAGASGRGAGSAGVAGGVRRGGLALDA